MRNVQTNIGVNAADYDNLRQTLGSRNIQGNHIFQFIICGKWQIRSRMLLTLVDQIFTQMHAKTIKRNDDGRKLF